MDKPNSSTDRVLRLDAYWPYQMTVLADRISSRTARVVRDEAGLNLSQWRVLAAVAEAPGRTSAEVVTITPMDKGIVSRATKALLEMGLLIREASQEDGRVSHLHLTDDGRALYQRLIPRVESILSRAAEALDVQQQSELGQYLQQLLAVIPDQRI